MNPWLLIATGGLSLLVSFMIETAGAFVISALLVLGATIVSSVRVP